VLRRVLDADPAGCEQLERVGHAGQRGLELLAHRRGIALGDAGHDVVADHERRAVEPEPLLGRVVGAAAEAERLLRREQVDQLPQQVVRGHRLAGCALGDLLDRRGVDQAGERRPLRARDEPCRVPVAIGGAHGADIVATRRVRGQAAERLGPRGGAARDLRPGPAGALGRDRLLGRPSGRLGGARAGHRRRSSQPR
jgi:hypothetical protein